MEYTLNNAPINKNLFLKEINYLNLSWKLRLTNLGFIKGEKIKIISRPTKHACLVSLRDVVYSVDVLQAEKVVVYD